jgi:hypothetical protein
MFSYGLLKQGFWGKGIMYYAKALWLDPWIPKRPMFQKRMRQLISGMGRMENL